MERRLVADVPLGVLLSGGLDSTIIAAVTTSLIHERLQTFTASFEGSPTYDEAAFARLVSQRLGTVHSEVYVGPDCIEQLDTLVDAHDGPFGDSSALPTYAVTQLARENVTVALSGEGSDEIFCGYLRFRAMEMASRVPGWAAVVGRKTLSSLRHDPSPPWFEKANATFLRGRGPFRRGTLAPLGGLLRSGPGAGHEVRRWVTARPYRQHPQGHERAK